MLLVPGIQPKYSDLPVKLSTTLVCYTIPIFMLRGTSGVLGIFKTIFRLPSTPIVLFG